MSDDYRNELNEYLQHADVRVEIRAVNAGDVPILTVYAPLGTDSVFALLIGGVRELARFVRAEPGARPFALGILEALPAEFEREMELSSAGPKPFG